MPQINSLVDPAIQCDGLPASDLERRTHAEEHVQRVIDGITAAEPFIEFGERDGPCVVEYRDWWERGWPMRRAFSCLGCRYNERDPEYRNCLCEHPDMIAKYGGHQSVAHNNWWRFELAAVHAFSCPVLRRAGVNAHCPLPEPEELAGRERSKAYRRHFPSEEAEIFNIPQRVPYYVAEAYARGELVDRQQPRY
jgi:hypothetical protein